MDTVRQTHTPQWVRLLLCAFGLALGWLVFSTAFGWGASPSHADDDDDRGLLGTVTGIVSQTVEVLPEPLEAVVDEPVEKTVAVVEKATTTTVKTVTKNTDAVVEAEPVRKVTRAVTTVVRKTPVVGAVAEELGLDEVVDRTGEVATEVIGDLGETVDDAVRTVTGDPADVGAPTPTVPGTPEIPAVDGIPVATSPGDAAPSSALAAAIARAVGADASLSPLSPWLTDATSTTSPAHASAAASPVVASQGGHVPAGEPLAPLTAPVCAVAGSSSGASSPSGGAGALPVSETPFACLAWSCAHALGDQSAPPSPPATPEVSPD